jgi:hypothetical protein
MAMSADRVIELCTQNAEVLKEDIALIEAGKIKFLALGVADVTREQVARLKGNLSRLQEIIDCSKT